MVPLTSPPLTLSKWKRLCDMHKTWACFTLVNQLNSFHYFSQLLSKYTYINAFPSSKACFLKVSANFSHREWKIKTSNYGSFHFFNFWNWAKIASNPYNFINFLMFTLVRLLLDLVRFLKSQVNVRFDHFWRFWLKRDF